MLWLVFVMLTRLLITALWSSAEKELTSWLLYVMSNCDFRPGTLVFKVKISPWEFILAPKHRVV